MAALRFLEVRFLSVIWPFSYMAVLKIPQNRRFYFGFMAAKRPIFSKIKLISLSFMAEFGAFCRIFWMRNGDFVCIQICVFGVGNFERKIDENPQNFRFYGRFENVQKSIREVRFLSVIWPLGYMAEKSRFWVIYGSASVRPTPLDFSSSVRFGLGEWLARS